MIDLKALARRFLPVGVWHGLSRWLGGTASYSYEVLGGGVPPELIKGWCHAVAAERQHAAFAPLLREMHKGKPREDFLAVVTAVERTGLLDPLVIEVGCGSGFNSEVLAHLLKRPVRYIGLDYSPAMTALGKRCYPATKFVVGDATALPFQDGACDILLSGTVLMHLLGYRKAVRESYRVARKWCIFHTVPILQHRGTTVLSKRAYGTPVVEIIFNEEELLRLIREAGFMVRHQVGSVPYDLVDVLGEHTQTKTYVCEVAE